MKPRLTEGMNAEEIKSRGNNTPILWEHKSFRRTVGPPTVNAGGNKKKEEASSVGVTDSEAKRWSNLFTMAQSVPAASRVAFVIEATERLKNFSAHRNSARATCCH
jgi:hypothetical protein